MDKKILEKASGAKKAAIKVAALSADIRKKALLAIAQALNTQKDKIFAANEADIKAAEAANLDKPLLKRLLFNDSKLSEVIAGLEALAKMEDLLGKVQMSTELDVGLDLYRISCPIGVIAIIFESRPDALVQISSLCLKSANAVLLKGGSEAKNTNRILVEIIRDASTASGLPEGWISLMETRDDVSEMLSLDKYIDLIIPRGSNSFVKYIMDNSNIPVLGHADGICHVFVDESADIDKAIPVCVDAKTQYVAVCNAMETLLVHEKIAGEFLPLLKSAMDQKNVRLLGCCETRKYIQIDEAKDADWDTEYLDYILSIKVVKGLDEAVEHINTHGSGHTDVILTENKESADMFVSLVDSAGVYINASSRFADGFVYGFGAEVGISTSKIHARGPVGIEGLLTYKYVLKGDYNYIEPYKTGEKKFTHKKTDKKEM
ncbi:MAG: glutamate-5-semialdehyde dehydrogenase [Clostridia bacterium]|nr:glutamate-5-semialdehyde dehydrogenase [Clostridia bacterium]